MKRVYSDNAATTPIAPEIIEMMSAMMKTSFANPSSVHSFGRESKIIVENARKSIADLLNTSPGFVLLNKTNIFEFAALTQGCPGLEKTTQRLVLLFF